MTTTNSSSELGSGTFLLSDIRAKLNMVSNKVGHTAALDDLKEDQIGVKAEHADVIEGQHPPSEEELRAVRRKIDWRLMPIMVGTYGLQFYGMRISSDRKVHCLYSSCLDKTALNQAALFGILQDLDLVEVTNVNGTIITNTQRYSYGRWTKTVAQTEV